ncbi:type-1 angiotensin II receptor-associated protein-like [Panulirus ornatus]|uniref:type-1 angiotensin II receptor-associated protein-like n=1 Tax=Panulirus ornatus TaxID=150431 RepID=UPI003A85F524
MEMIKGGFYFLRRVSSTSLSKQDRLDILFGIFFVHLILTVWSNLCGCLPQSFIIYNTLFLLTLVWSLHHRESEEAPFMALCTNVLAIVFDTVNLTLFWPFIMTGTMRFGATMAVLNLVVRPLSSFLLFRVVQDRAEALGGSSLPSGFEGFFAPRNRGPYLDIDQNAEPSPPSATNTENLPTLTLE